MNDSPKTLLDVPDDVLLPILAYLPFTSESFRSLRLVCKRINDLTRTKALYREVARSQFPDIGPLFFIELNEINIQHVRGLRNRLDMSVPDMLGTFRIGHATPTTFSSIVKKGIALIWWLSHQAIKCPGMSAVADPLLDLAEKGQLDFAAMLAIRTAIVCIFDALPTSAKIFYGQWNCNFAFYTNTPQDGQDGYRLFFAFEAAVLWSKRAPTNARREMLQICNQEYMRDAFGAMIDTSGLAAVHLRRNLDNAASVAEPWTVSPSLMRAKVSSCQNSKEFVGLDFDTLDDIQQVCRIRGHMMKRLSTEAMLKSLNLEKLGRIANLHVNNFEAPSPQYWQL